MDYDPNDPADVLARIVETTEKVAQEADENAAVREETKALLQSLRAPSKAGLIGTRGRPDTADYEAGGFIRAVMLAGSRDADEQAAGKAYLAAVSRRMDVPEYSKSTLGLTDATGGWILPNPIVDQLVKPAPSPTNIVDLMTVRSGLAGAVGIDIPWRGSAPDRAVIAAWGSLKENKDLVYNGYTATMYTLARIYDISKQFVRKSAGAAEQDVISELREAFRRGINYYAWNGTGTAMPFGLMDAIAGQGWATSAFSPAASLAGSVTAAIGTALGALAGRGYVNGLTAVMSATSYTNLRIQGADTAGFYLSGVTGEPVPGYANGTPIVFGVPCIADPECPADDLFVGDFSAVKIYQGEGFRIDTSDQAGDRWDYNLVGFRGEQEIGFDFRPAVYSGAIQYVADIVP